MSEIKEYRPINEDERIEIDQLAAKGLVLIGLQESAESSVILDGIKNYLHYCPVKAGKSVFEIVET